MFACACAPESVCAGRKGARQASPSKRPEIKFIHSRPAERGLSGGGALGAGGKRARPPLQGCSGTRTPLARSRARPPRSPGRAAAPPSLHSGGEGAVFRGGPGPQGGGGDWERASGAAGGGELSQPREEEGAGAGGGGGGGSSGSSAGSSSYEQGHVHGAPPGRAANRGEALRAASAKLPQGSGPHWGDPGGPRPPARAGAPQLLEPKFAQAPASSASLSSLQSAGLADRARPGCESRRPSLGPGAAWV